jgi:hypothetical protein
LLFFGNFNCRRTGNIIIAQHAFTVSGGTGRKIAYYGIRIKGQKTVFHKSFNPELYLYNFSNIDPEKEVYFTTDIFECIKWLQKDIPAVCNFGLLYLSSAHLELLQTCKFVSVMCENGNMDEIKKQFFENFPNYVKFIKPTSKAL